MKNIKKQIQLSLLVLVTMFSVGVATPFASEVSAKCTGSRVFTFPTWYNGLPGTCQEPILTELNDVWIVVMNFIEMLLQVVAYVSTGFIIWGGFKYMKSEGDPARISEAKSAILNAIIGLVIAFASVAIVSYIQSRFTTAETVTFIQSRFTT